MSQINIEKATFGAGCFWCIEAVFSELNGVQQVVAGYTGGQSKNPTYNEICSGATGHAEVAQISFDPSIISFETLLAVFWKTHDPTTLNQQGNDIGTQYRSVIYYHNDYQQATAEEIKKDLNDSGAWDNLIITEISALETFYAATEDHQNYYLNNSEAGYCRMVIQPKLDEFRKVFKNQLK